jgi:2-dehydro-3-deoxygalactonokinase
MTDTRWIALDWGTSHLRAWLMDADDGPLARRDSERGMSTLTPEGYEPALLDLIGDALPQSGPVPVICCGMAGARQGWAEAPYRSTPCRPPTLAEARRAPTRDPRLDVRILPGVQQASPADVMRGEETQIAGVLAERPGFDGVLCLPGTHSKWVHVSAGEIVAFRTFMTGELFALLAGHSVLRHSIAAEGWDAAAFTAAVEDGLSHPARFAAALFGLRAESLLAGLAAETARARLSGWLIGLELGAARPFWLGRAVLIVGESDLAAAYAAALTAQGAAPETLDAARATLAGLAAARSAGEGLV